MDEKDSLLYRLKRAIFVLILSTIFGGLLFLCGYHRGRVSSKGQADRGTIVGDCPAQGEQCDAIELASRSLERSGEITERVGEQRSRLEDTIRVNEEYINRVRESEQTQEDLSYDINRVDLLRVNHPVYLWYNEVKSETSD